MFILVPTKKRNDMIENQETRNEQNKPTPSNGSALGGLIALGIAIFIIYTICTM